MFQRKTFVSVLLAGVIGLPALAQETPPAAEPAAEPADLRGIEEITITARKVAENLQETPLSVSAIDAAGLENLGIQDTRDITALAPNAYFTQTPGSSANLALAIRGVGGAEPLLTREQGVAVYMDGAYIARVTGAIMDLVDIERVEILRGPQGTLYGRNATGGAVNFISRKPSEDFGFEGRLGTGSFSRFEGMARINTGELLPGMAATAAYLHRQKDGYINNRLSDDNSDPGSQNTDAFRLALGWDITEELRFDYSFDYENLIGEDPAFQLFAVAGFPGSITSQLEISDDRLDDLSLDQPGLSEHTIRAHNLTLEYDFGPVQLKSITTYRDWENDEFATELDGNAIALTGVSIYDARILPFDPAGIPFGDLCDNVPFNGAPAFPYSGCLLGDPANPGTTAPTTGQLFAADNVRNQDQWTQEIQVLGSIGESFDYVGGFYYFTEEYDEFNRQQFLIPLGFAAVQLMTPFDYNGEARAWALFANGTYTLPVLDERISFTGGLRYSKDRKSFVKRNRTCTNPSLLPPCDTSVITSLTKNSDTWDSIDWEANLKFQATESINTYFRVATAYKAGGFNLRTSLPVIDPFEEEQLLQYELGVKTRWWDDRVQLNLAAFYSDYDDIQTDIFAAGPAGATSITVNGGQAEIPGVELEFLAEPFEGVRLNMNYGWIDPKYKSYKVRDNNGTTVTCPPAPVPPTPGCLPDPTVDDFSVDMADEAEFGYRPEQTLSAGAEYSTPPLGSLGWIASARLDVRWTGGTVWSPLDDERPTVILNGGPGLTAFRDVLFQQAYTLLDARFTISEISINDRAKLRATVYGKNITDEEYLLSGIDFGGLGFAGGIFGEPSTWGLDFTLTY
jgi:iron complex outermembrane receptor protein